MEGEKLRLFFLQGRGEIWDSSSQGSESVRFTQNRMLGGSAKRGGDARWSRKKETGNASFSYVSVKQSPIHIFCISI